MTKRWLGTGQWPRRLAVLACGVLALGSGVVAGPSPVSAAPTVPAAPAASVAPAQVPTRPVLLIGGTLAGKASLDNHVAPWLENAGYDVYTMELATDPDWNAVLEGAVDLVALAIGLTPAEASGAGTASMDPSEPVNSTAAVSTTVNAIRFFTGAQQVDIIAHSQGGPVARNYIKNGGGSSVVHTLISLGGIEWGIPGDPQDPVQNFLLDWACGTFSTGVCDDVFYSGTNPITGASPFFQSLNAGDDTPGATRYYHLWTASDQPPAGLRLDGGATSRSVNDIPGCANYTLANHYNEWEDPVMRDLMEAALEGRTLASDSC